VVTKSGYTLLEIAQFAAVSALLRGPADCLEQIEAEGRLWKQNPQRLREVMAPGAARAKIQNISPHALRHTFGTRWLQAGGDIFKLSKILGHASVAVTEEHYAHLLKEDLVAASRQVRIPIA
jgi:integrase